MKERHFYRRVLSVALPMMIQNGITNFVQMLDNVMVGQVGTIPMSGGAIVNQLMFVFNLCVFGAASGAGIFTAQFKGREDQEGILPLRVTHNDTKLNNVLLDKQTRTALCVLDLDTVMPGLSIFDFGDSIRFGAATAAEDEKDLSKMEMDLHLFEVYTRGFLEAATSLTDAEVEALPMGAYTMTLECGTRFLKDYLDGDVYFKVNYPDHNLVRARTQMKLVADMEKKMDQMNAIVAKVAAEVRK